MSYVPTIGLEVHAELKTKTKLFCDSPNDPAEKHPNVNICPICMGHPGTLPVLNKTAVEHVIKAGLALRSEIAAFTKWDRKNYFYPDLPKGYQISQYDLPLCRGGWLEIKGKSDGDAKRIHIRRVHLEEDTGRLVHEPGKQYSLVDFNRAGVPLMELVTEPDIQSGAEARACAQELQLVFRYLGVSDADMERGQMRVEANISVREPDAPLGTKVEIKNLNSFRSVERAIQYEVARQSALLESGGVVVQETRGWNEATAETFSQRVKEEAEEYRYFPEPDLPPLDLRASDAPISVRELQVALPELPWSKRERLGRQYALPEGQVAVLVGDPPLAGFYERTLSELQEWLAASAVKGVELPVVANLAANYLTSDLVGLLQKEGLSIGEIRITPENFAELIKMVVKQEVSSRVAKDVLGAMLHHAGEPDPSVIVEERGLKQIGDTNAIEAEIAKVLEANPKAVEDFRSGKENALQFLAGQVMKATKGAANPALVQELLKKSLSPRH
ncbi:MAG: Asp-tRNA(Asn)/Glu-tRNA(Gln) amidotransferase subunit GatB [bacterium]|nr:Asp-tRNA(Asn)/Glu-tRNA(Gln) amidotransferase subunit GatB [bacterium]MDZ4296257.1 Asp-tRNA(Asn)/Glu-tRNA(Gln) amidotransferase subunit GatB [Patescibacteria group bacterium]